MSIMLYRVRDKGEEKKNSKFYSTSTLESICLLHYTGSKKEKRRERKMLAALPAQFHRDEIENNDDSGTTARNDTGILCINNI